MTYNPVNPFGGIVNDYDEITSNISQNKIHIRIRQRNARRTITTVEGLNSDLDLKRILSHLKKQFKCGGAIIIDEETDNKILKFSGDQRINVRSFLIQEYIATERDIIVHGY